MLKKFLPFLLLFSFLGITSVIILTIHPTDSHKSAFAAGSSIKTVFIILMENHNWSDIKANSPYLVNTLLPMGSHAEQYYNPPGNHPSLPNYLWLEAGTNFGIADDNDPSINHQATTQHLVTLLQNKGIPWKAYEEDIPGTDCPLTVVNNYAPKHDPFVYFDDVTNNLDTQSQNCIQHVRPYTELATDLTNNTISGYNFITPNLCNDTHDCSIATGDTWLSQQIPKILNSQAYQNGGMILITFDEGAEGNQDSDGPIPLIILSPFAKKNYSNTIHYTHSSTLKTMEEIFGVTPLLGDAANAIDLSDFFTIPISGTQLSPTGNPEPSITGSPTTTAGTQFSATLCPHGLGNCGDNVKEGIGGNTAPKHTARQIQITFLTGQNQIVATASGTVSYNQQQQVFTGTIPGTSIPSGQYLVTISMQGYLAKQYPGIITVTQGQAVTLPSLYLTTGDINGDNQLDILDYNLLISCFGTKQGTSSCTMPPTTNASGSDVNDNGVVDALDYNLFLRELSVQKGS